MSLIDKTDLLTGYEVLTRDNSFASATSVAAHATETGPIGAGTSTPTATQTPTSGGRAMGGSNNWQMGALVGMVVGSGQFI